MHCVQIDGGATELTWSLRTMGGEKSDCLESNVDKVRLCWLHEGQGSECLPDQSRDFSCAKLTGTTLFEIADGRTEFFVQPICLDGLPADNASYQSPANIVRTVREGEIVTLSSLLIVVSEPGPACTSNCTCVR